MYRVTDLGDLSGFGSEAYGINGSGQAVGYAYATNLIVGEPLPYQRAVVYQNGVVSALAMSGALGSVATSINDGGDVVGQAFFSGIGQHAFLYRGGVATNLGTLAGPTSLVMSNALAVNGGGQVVGWSYGVAGGAYHAFLYQNGTMSDLGTLGGTYSDAVGINDAGQIVGEAGWRAGSGTRFCMRTGG
jgi:probable HAF family extracellular repeat protein